MMNLDRRTKILIGLGTLWVIVYMIILTITGFAESSFRSAYQTGNEMQWVTAFVPIHCITAAIYLGLFIFYIAHIIKNNYGDDTQRVAFAVGMFFLPYITMPIYYFKHILPDKPSDSAAESQMETASQN